MKNRRLRNLFALGAALATTTLTSTADTIASYDASVGNPANAGEVVGPLPPIWVPNDGSLAPGDTQTGVFEGGQGAWQNFDSTANNNPGYVYAMSGADYQAMYDEGFVLTMRFRIPQGGQFMYVGGDNTNTGGGYDFPGDRRLGVSAGVSGDDYTVAPVCVGASVGTVTVTDGVLNATYVRVVITGDVAAQSGTLEVYNDDTDALISTQTFTGWANGNTSTDAHTGFMSGSSGGDNREGFYREFTLETTPVPPIPTVDWTGTGGTTWDLNNTVSWDDSGAVAYQDGDDVEFSDSASPNGTVVIDDSLGAIAPTSVQFTNTAALPYTLSGDPLSGTTDLAVKGGGNVTVGNANSYTGGTSITSGTLTLVDGGSLTGDISVDDSLVLNMSGTETVSNVILGSGTLTVSGSGTLTLDADNNFTGGTTVTDGTLVLGQANAIGHNGTFGGKITVVDGTFDTNGMVNYVNGIDPLAPETWLTTAATVVGGASGATPEIADTGAIPKGIAFSNGSALTYDETNDPGTATISARWTQSGSSNAATRSVIVGDSAATTTEVDFTGGLGDVLGVDGRSTTIRKLGLGTMQISSDNTFPRLRVSEGTLRVNHVDALGTDRTDLGGLTSRLWVETGGILDLNGFSPSTGALADNGDTTGVITNDMAATTSTLSVGSSGTTTAYGGAIQDGLGTTALTVEGGQLTLEGIQTYTGATTVTGGILRVDSGGSLASAVTTQGGFIAGGADAAIGTSFLPALNLDGGGVFARVAANTSSDTIDVTGLNGFAVNAPSTISADVDPGAVVPFTTTVIEYNGTIQGSLGFSGLITSQHGPYSLNDTGSAIELTATGDAADTLIWVGNVSGDWATGGDSNWKLLSDSTSVAVFEMDKVFFDDTATGPTTVTLTGSITPESMEFNNSTLVYALDGSDINSGSDIVKNGTAALTISNVLTGSSGLIVNGGDVTILSDSTYTGGTTVNAGMLTFGNGGTDGDIGQGITTIVTGASLTINTSDFLDYKANDRLLEVIGGGDITFTGGGTLFNYPNDAGAQDFAAPNSWDQFSGNLTVKGDSEFLTIRQGSTAMGTGTVILGDGGSSGSLAQIEGSWTWTNDISLIGSDNKIITRSTGTGRSLKLQAVISGSGGLTFEDPDATMTNLGTGFILTGDNTLDGFSIPVGVPVRVGGVPGEFTSTAAGDSGSIGTATVANEGFLGFTRDNAHTVDATISGAGAVNVFGVDTQVMTLTTTNTYDGPTTVQDGTLIVAGAIGDSPTVVNDSGVLLVNGTLGTGATIVDVDPGGMIGGTGTVDGEIILSGTLSPGASVGTLTGTSYLDFEASSTYTWEISTWGGAAGTGYDQVVAETITMLNTSTPGEEMTIVITPDNVSGFTESNQTYVIATAGSLLDAFDPAAILIDDTAFAAATGSAGTWAVQQTGETIELVYTLGIASDYDVWLALYTFAPGDDQTPTGDPDGDGLSNEEEYAFGLDPTSGASVNAITTGLNKTTGTFTYQRRTGTGLSYKVWTSTTLASWTEDSGATESVSPDGTNEQVTVTLSGAIPLTAPKLFIQVTAE